MRIVGRFPDQRQVGAVVDSLKNIGLDRKDMIISNLADDRDLSSPEEAAHEITFVKTETDGLGEYKTFAEGVKGLEGEEGIIVSVKTPKHGASRIREVMEQSGAVEIIQD